MDVKFGDVLAGGAGRPRKPEHHRIVDRLPPASRSSARVAVRAGGILPRQRRQRRPGLRPGYPHHGDRARRPAGRQRKNGLVPRMHRLFVPESLKRQRNFDAERSLDLRRPAMRYAAAMLQHLRSNYAAKIAADAPRPMRSAIHIVYFNNLDNRLGDQPRFLMLRPCCSKAAA